MAEHRTDPRPPIPKSDIELLAQCRVQVFRAGGKGGQHQNVTESGVRLIHLPTGTVVSSRRRRSQHANKREALAVLRRKLITIHHRRKPRIPTGVPKRVLARRRRVKRRRSLRKALRQTPKLEDN
ncbi:MAG: peptide chain release factor-like protein [Gemmatimonadota bacterium]|nr:peptide chain release factor-like protein [Gemmatimonadota bacterium]